MGKINYIQTDWHYKKLNNMGAWYFDRSLGCFTVAFQPRQNFQMRKQEMALCPIYFKGLNTSFARHLLLLYFLVGG